MAQPAPNAQRRPGGVSDRPWSTVQRSDYADAAEYCAACLIDENAAGARPVKARCKLPVYEPRSLGGQLNRRAVHAAADRLLRKHGGVQAPLGARRAAARQLLRLYALMGDQPPHGLAAFAGPAAERRLRGLDSGQLV